MSDDHPLDVPEQTYERIERAIGRDDTPMGIDAKKAHVAALHKLVAPEKRPDRIEERLDA